MSTIADVAREAGVSKATASRALSGSPQVSAATRQRVLDVALELGYAPSTSAVSLATGRTRNIGVILPHVDRWFFAEVLEGIQESLLERGFDLTLYDATPGSIGRERVFTELLARKRFDGLIAVGLEPAVNELQSLLSLGRPVVSVIGTEESTSLVALDDSHAAGLATSHLLALGHRRIAFLGGTSSTHWPHVESARYEGYERVMRESGLDAYVSRTPAELSMPAGYEAAVDLLSDSSQRPTAVVGACDEVAIGAIIAARRLGLLVPSELSVIGIDDHVNAEMFALTTLRQVPREQGATAVELLMRHLDDPTLEPIAISIRPRLVVRNSTAAPSGATPAAVRDSGLSRVTNA